MRSIKKALILAAGRGRRLMPFTKDRPKCLVEIGGGPYLAVENLTLQSQMRFL